MLWPADGTGNQRSQSPEEGLEAKLPKYTLTFPFRLHRSRARPETLGPMRLRSPRGAVQVFEGPVLAQVRLVWGTDDRDNRAGPRTRPPALEYL